MSKIYCTLIRIIFQAFKYYASGNQHVSSSFHHSRVLHFFDSRSITHFEASVFSTLFTLRSFEKKSRYFIYLSRSLHSQSAIESLVPNIQTANMVFSMKSLATATAIFSIAQGAVLGKRALTGQATTYGGNTAGGTCSFSTYTLPSTLFGTALSDSNWDNAANCGRCVSVTGPSGNSITAMVSRI
jgi:hypothetical protein